jgi:glycosyltransferase involved in cell wall biosynthesis
LSSEKPLLLILSGVQADPRRYRTFHLYEQARLAGLSCQLSHVTDSQLRAKVKSASIVILHRAAFDSQIAWLENEVHRQGGILILDLDDLVFDPDAIQYIHSPDFADPIRRSLYREDVLNHRKTLDLCDYVLTSTDYLAQRVRLLGKPAIIHRNAFSLEMLAISDAAYRSRRNNPGKLILGYASGTPTHDQDFAIIKPALKSILSRFSNAELRLVGPLQAGDDWGRLGDRIVKINRLPWRRLPEIQTQFDINLAPLLMSNPFGQSKSEIKYVEAALLRVPTIASPSESFNYAIQDGENGGLVEQPTDWEQALDDLLRSSDRLIEWGKNAYQDVLQRYHPIVRARQLLNTLNGITGNKFELEFNSLNRLSPETKITGTYWSSADLERSPSLLQRGLYTLQHRNLPTLLKQIWIFIRRTVSPLFPYPNPR